MNPTRRAVSPAYLLLDILGEALTHAAEAVVKKGAHAFKAAQLDRNGATPRPGTETPLWNALVAEIRPHLNQRGTQAQLARLLGLQRQQINAYFTQRTRMPDAERTLQLIAWLVAMREKRNRPEPPVAEAPVSSAVKAIHDVNY